MRGWRWRAAAAAMMLFGAGATLTRMAAADEESDVNAAMARCQSEAAKYERGPLADKLWLMRMPTAAMMANAAHPSAAEVPVIQDFAASMETCLGGFKSLAIKYVPESLAAQDKVASAREAMLADLLAGRISYGQANIRDRDAKLTFAGAMQDLIARRNGRPSAGTPFAPRPQYQTPPSMAN